MHTRVLLFGPVPLLVFPFGQCLSYVSCVGCHDANRAGRGEFAEGFAATVMTSKELHETIPIRYGWMTGDGDIFIFSSC